MASIGNEALLGTRKLGLLCSRACPGSIILRTLDAVRELRAANWTVVGGFQSPVEQECLELLLRGEKPVIVCPGRSVDGMRVPSAWKQVIDAGRMLITSPFAERVRRTTAATAEERNRFVVSLVDAVCIPYAAPGGSLGPTTGLIASRAWKRDAGGCEGWSVGDSNLCRSRLHSVSALLGRIVAALLPRGVAARVDPLRNPPIDAAALRAEGTDLSKRRRISAIAASKFVLIGCSNEQIGGFRHFWPRLLDRAGRRIKLRFNRMLEQAKRRRPAFFARTTLSRNLNERGRFALGLWNDVLGEPRLAVTASRFVR